MNEGESLLSYRSFLSEFGTRLKEYCTSIKSEVGIAKSESDELFLEGKLLACHNIVSMLQNDAFIAGIPLSDLNMEGFDPNIEIS